MDILMIAEWMFLLLTSYLALAVLIVIATRQPVRFLRSGIILVCVLIGSLYFAGRIGFAQMVQFMLPQEPVLICESAVAGLYLLGAILLWIYMSRNGDKPQCRAMRIKWGWLLVGLILSIGANIAMVALNNFGLGMSKVHLASDMRDLEPSANAPFIDEKANAAPLYRTLIKARESLSEEANYLWQMNEIDQTSPANRKSLLANAPLVEIARQAAGRDKARIETDLDHVTIDTVVPEWQGMSLAASVLRPYALSEAADGKLPLALSDVQYMEKVALHAEQIPSFSGLNLATRVHRSADDTLVSILPQINDKQMLALVPFSADIFPTIVLKKGLVIEERMNIRWLIQEPFAPTVLRPEMSPWFSWIGMNTWQGPVMSRGGNSLIQEMKLIRKLLDQPYWQYKPQLDQICSPNTGNLPHFVQSTVVTIPLMMDNIQMSHASRQATLIAIAATRYRLDKGSYPDAPAKLTPGYLAQWPGDPFDGQPMRMKRQADGSLLIYSVGKDLKDDGGDVVQNTDSRKQPLDVGHRLALATKSL